MRAERGIVEGESLQTAIDFLNDNAKNYRVRLAGPEQLHSFADTFLTLFVDPRNGKDKVGFVSVSTDQDRSSYAYVAGKLCDLELPSKVKLLSARSREKPIREKGLVAIFALGPGRRTREEITVLYARNHIKPETAFGRLQKAAINRQISLVA